MASPLPLRVFQLQLKREHTYSRGSIQLLDGFPHLVTLRARRRERAGASEALVVRDLARGIAIRFLGSIYATAQESPSPYVVFFPITSFSFLEETFSSPTTCRLRNCGREGMIVSSSLSLFHMSSLTDLLLSNICSMYVLYCYSHVASYVALCLLQI